MVYIWVRTAVDWEDEEAVLAQAPPETRAKIEVWNRTLDMPFHRFRHRVQAIARDNLSRVQDAVVARWEEIPDGALVAPVDDDDWFAPHLGPALEGALADGALGCYWPSTFVEVPIDLRHRLGLVRERLQPGRPPLHLCTTNNYALVKREDTRCYLRRHVRASRWVERDAAGRVRPIEGRLSAMNRTLGSQTSLGARHHTISPRRLVRKLRQYQRRYRHPRPTDPEWCRPHMALMAALMDEVAPNSSLQARA